MPGQSSKTLPITIRISVNTYTEIDRLIKSSPRLDAESIRDYCQKCIERYVWRHSKTKYRKLIY